VQEQTKIPYTLLDGTFAKTVNRRGVKPQIGVEE